MHGTVMSAYDVLWGVAEGNYGIITSAKAKGLGVSRQCLVAMERSGRLMRLGHGVYQVKHHVVGRNDRYAASVAVAGEGAYLRGASVVQMLGLTPASPPFVYLGTPRRVRRRLPKYCRLACNRPCEVVEYEGFEGIKCQRLVEAMRTARADGAIGPARLRDAAHVANGKGLLTDAECAEFARRPDGTRTKGGARRRKSKRQGRAS